MRMGVDRRSDKPEAHRLGRPRWRSLARWLASAPAWWPTRPVSDGTWREQATSLLAGFVPGDAGREGAIRRAVSAHAAGGTAM